MKRSALRLLRWFYPGLGVKRWLVVAALGAVLFVNGAYRWLLAEGMHFEVDEFVDNFFDDFMPVGWLMWIFMVSGVVLVVVGIRQWMRAIVAALTPERKDNIVEALFDMRLRRGYRIVAIGGGTGLSTLLRGLKRYTSNLTAVVTVTDDGGSSGRLQKELGILPPGDVRNCLVALADDEAMVTDLFRYRFTEGDGLSGHSFGNLFLAAMTGITGNFDKAIKESSRVLNIKGRVLPATLANVRLHAVLLDGTEVVGETNISKSTQPIQRLTLEPAAAEPLDEVIAAIREADAIILGPGSLYTSILPNLLVRRIAKEIATASCAKMYVCNVMTQPGETDEFTASQHVRALLDHTSEHVCDYAIVNEQAPRRLLEAYAEEGQIPVQPDIEAIEAMGLRVVGANVISETQTVRHDSARLAEVLIHVIDDYVVERSSFVRLTTAQPVPSAPVIGR
ncbi:MAG TPA: gluconeogenesis factor YvcK family protein [Candidatus Acidoferrales bacterium]|nr:gluconeogenesis factor YvcK family protein [Candidatus Acidoferrales bacterium]